MEEYHEVEQAGVRNKEPYGTIRRRLWDRADFRALSFEAKAVYTYAKTCPAGNIAGVFPLRPEDVRDDLGLGPRLAERALRELEETGFIQRDRHWVWIVDALETTPNVSVLNPKHRVAAQKALANAPESLAFACRNLYGLNTHSPIPNPIPNQDVYPNRVDGDGDGDGRPARMESGGKEAEKLFSTEDKPIACDAAGCSEPGVVARESFVLCASHAEMGMRLGRKAG